MAKYRKKPVVIEAVQYTGDLSSVYDFVKSTRRVIVDEIDYRVIVDEIDYLVIKTLEGDMRADKGDWIIKGISGEFYPCKPDIFKATYDEVNDGR